MRAEKEMREGKGNGKAGVPVNDGRTGRLQSEQCASEMHCPRRGISTEQKTSSTSSRRRRRESKCLEGTQNHWTGPRGASLEGLSGPLVCYSMATTLSATMAAMEPSRPSMPTSTDRLPAPELLLLLLPEDPDPVGVSVWLSWL